MDNDLFKSKMLEHVKNIEHWLHEGQVKDFTHYREMVAQRKALMHAIEVSDKLEYADEE